MKQVLNLIKTAFIPFLFILCFTCKREEIVNNGCNVIKIDPEAKVNYIDITTITDSLEIIKLETNDKSTFAKIDRVYYVGNRIFILSRRESAIIIFNNKGKFLTKMQKIGRGPGEYSQIVDFTVNEDTQELIILADIPKSYMFYDYDGNFIKKIDNEHYFYSICYNNGQYILAKDITNKKNDYRIFLFESLNKRPYSRYLPIHQGSEIHSSFGQSLVNISSKPLLCNSFSDNTIYAINSHSVVAAYEIDFLEKNIPNDYLSYNLESKRSMEQFQRLMQSDYFFYPSNITESENYLIFEFHPTRYYCVFNRKSEKVEYAELFFDPNYFLPLTKNISMDKKPGYILFSLQPSMIIDTWSQIKENLGEIEEISYPVEFSDINSNDNPILLIYRLR